MKRLVPLSMIVLMMAGACASAEPVDTGSTAASAPSSISTTTTSSTSIGTTEPDPVEGETVAEEPLPGLGPAEELRGIDGWLQTDIDSLEDLKGNVVVVQFWTFGCHNCKATFPNLEALYADHQGADFEIVGVHSPEFDYEEDPDAIAAAAQDLGVRGRSPSIRPGRASVHGRGLLPTGRARTYSTARGISASTTSVRVPTTS